MSSARGARSEKVPDLNINGNASPDGDLSIPAEAEAYFTLDSNVSDTLIKSHCISSVVLLTLLIFYIEGSTTEQQFPLEK